MILLYILNPAEYPTLTSTLITNNKLKVRSLLRQNPQLMVISSENCTLVIKCDLKFCNHFITFT